MFVLLSEKIVPSPLMADSGKSEGGIELEITRTRLRKHDYNTYIHR